MTANIEPKTRHGINFPVPPADAPELTVEQVRDLIESVRERRSN